MEDDSRHEFSYDLNTSNSRQGGSFQGKQPHQPAVVTHPFVVCQPPIKLTLCLLQGFHEPRPLFLIGCWPHLFAVGLVLGPQRPTARIRSAPTTGPQLPHTGADRELWVKPGVSFSVAFIMVGSVFRKTAYRWRRHLFVVAGVWTT